jgi:hypothetical protein
MTIAPAGRLADRATKGGFSTMDAMLGSSLRAICHWKYSDILCAGPVQRLSSREKRFRDQWPP